MAEWQTRQLEKLVGAYLVRVRIPPLPPGMDSVKRADVVELADTPGLGPGALCVEVRILSSARNWVVKVLTVSGRA